MGYTKNDALCFLDDFADVRAKHDGDGWPWNVATTAYDMLADMVEQVPEKGEEPRETRWLTPKQYAEMFGVDPCAVRVSLREGSIPGAVKPLGNGRGQWRIPVEVPA